MILELEGIRKSFAPAGGPSVDALRDVSLSVLEGEFLALLGPSGCGKTTLLRCIAGLEVPSAGRVVVGGRVVVDAASRVFVAPGQRSVGMVFQSYGIWPHMTVAENVRFPLGDHHGSPRLLRRGGRLRRREVQNRVLEALRTVGLERLENRRASTLSGGQQQRVALARAIVGEPSVLLLDEPLSNVDAKLRVRLRVELRRLQRELGVTTVYVTHDQTDALSMADRVVVLNQGSIAQIGAPTEVYDRPIDPFVADFVGRGNFIDGTLNRVERDKATSCVDTDLGELICGWRSARLVDDGGTPVSVFVRPEHVSMVHQPSGTRTAATYAADTQENTVSGVVVDRLYFGEVVEYMVEASNISLTARCSMAARQYGIGDRVVLSWPSRSAGVLPSSTRSGGADNYDESEATSKSIT